ncbi:SCO family protein [Flavihumibacter petaseus]|uniref:Putative cytochrome c oxidase accessory protein n=1 Tax=Flavihumibacter petaseus NBRC 106054 TaxID=1220578 RepID=A0A0E9MXK6_9BACT|nr:SCO family protein [Flavihumibacter petaseus]GAO42238.1 putative cytochrome c oxidase accessory protein [Flavihumibacter petaseus NBRC 106054]
MKKRTAYYLIFFLVLFGGFLFAMTRFIPGFGKVSMPVLSTVKPFSFTDQNGKTFSNQQTEGKVYVAEYFFTTCPGICPKMNRNLKTVYDNYKNEPGFLILSHSVDPGTDSVTRMKIYADSLGVNGGNWHFLTGSKDSLYLAARISYLLDDPKNNNKLIEDQFIHTQFFALVDKNGQVRRIYDGLKKDEVNQLITDIPVLLKEKAGGRGHFANGIFNNNPQ